MEFLSIKEVCRRLTIGRTQLWKLEKAGGFPKSIRITFGRKVFVANEIDEWMRARVAERDMAA